jgi:RHS repeat-associated protein
MSYDSNGNTTSKSDFSGTTTYSWDFDNRLTSVTLPGQFGTVSFRYDRIRRRIYKSSSSGTSIYAYDGSNLAEETNASGAPVARYAQGLNIDQPLAMLRSGTVSYHEADGLGSVASLSNTAGVTASNYMYDSFGNLVATSGSVVNNFRYTGREFDTETGLYYYCAKYYDPVNGRFASEDPLKFFGGDINLCRYVWNHPTSLRDPRGLWGAGVVGSAGAFRGLGGYLSGGATVTVGGAYFADTSAPSASPRGFYLGRRIWRGARCFWYSEPMSIYYLSWR